MFKKLLIKNFNNKYANKELMFCNRIYEDITFMPDHIRKCCHCNRMPYSPPVLHKYTAFTPKFNFYIYLKNIDRIMASNQKENGACCGCTFLKKQTVPEFKADNFIKFITVNHFTKCNSNCVYCDVGNTMNNVNLELLPILAQMKKENMIDSSVLFNWGGGEPTLCNEFEQIAKFALSNKYRQAVNSSGIIFSHTILDGLKDGSISIQISPDAGTSETYQKIKRQNNFNTVWENIKRYAQYPDMLFVKYIFFSLSANEYDVREFINKCIDSGVKHIVIDCESNTAHNPKSIFGSITENMVNLAILMKDLAIANNIGYEISYQWPVEHKKKIENG